MFSNKRKVYSKQQLCIVVSRNIKKIFIESKSKISHEVQPPVCENKTLMHIIRMYIRELQKEDIVDSTIEEQR